MSQETAKNQNLNLRDYLEFLLLTEQRRVFFTGFVFEENVREASAKIDYLAGLNQEPITLVLNSGGGFVYDGLMLYNSIKAAQRRGVKVTVEVRGIAASMAAVILQAADQRLATEETRFLIHEIQSFGFGSTAEMEEQVSEVRKLNDLLNNIIAKRTGKTLEEVNSAEFKKDVWLNANEALEFGLIDKLLINEPLTPLESLKEGFFDANSCVVTLDSIEVPDFVEGIDLYPVHAFAFHPVDIKHPKDEVPRLYSAIKQQLIDAVPSIVGKNVDIDHDEVYRDPEKNIIERALWNKEEDAMEIFGHVDKFHRDLIGFGCPCSIKINWIREGGGIKAIKHNGKLGIVPFGFEYGGLSILEKMRGGDPSAWINLVEGIAESLKTNKNKIKGKKTEDIILDEISKSEEKSIENDVKTVNFIQKLVKNVAKSEKNVQKSGIVEQPTINIVNEPKASIPLETVQTVSEVVELRQKINDAEAAQIDAERKVKDIKQELNDFKIATIAKLEAVMPNSMTISLWKGGARIFAYQVRDVLNSLKNNQ